MFGDITVLNYTVTTDSVNLALANVAVFTIIAATIAWMLLVIIGRWKMYEKADEAGWKSIIPFYNFYTLFRIAGRNGWLFLLLIVPVVGWILWIIIALDTAEHYGKGMWFALFGLLLFSPIGELMLGFGKAEYVGQKHA